ncbi:MAG TPA: hypothetical protein VGP77_09215 [Vicinamibacterales bacterium]|jgi:hypothetical protein|nr:hypothetical protein [Vicinamibacterales bacterium]
MVTYGFLVLGLAVAAQAVAIWRMSRALRGAARLNERLSHFAEALALLTDTTETGLSNVAAELERSGHRRAARSVSRGAAAKRIVTAARRGQAIGDIAANEAMSESEIRLHLSMAPE